LVVGRGGLLVDDLCMNRQMRADSATLNHPISPIQVTQRPTCDASARPNRSTRIRRSRASKLAAADGPAAAPPAAAAAVASAAASAAAVAAVAGEGEAAGKSAGERRGGEEAAAAGARTSSAVM
jgi:hypothetical protein